MCYTVAGIIMNCLGAIISIWGVITSKEDLLGTVEWHDNLQQSLKKQYKQVTVGSILIIIGTVLQVVGALG